GGFVNKQGQIVIQPTLEYAGQFTNGLAYAEINGKSGFINKRGRFIIEPKFQINKGSRFK
ncbi:MAG: WG repeat-containing protein, partial [Chitinophagaceae bacterium]|nr:WG repeat-containing protein [Chitinophagaceae bacterium]